MNAPKASCQRRPGSLTITIDVDSWPTTRDFFYRVSDACEEKAKNMKRFHPSQLEDAEYLERIADAILEAVHGADQDEQDDISRVFE